MSNENRKMMIMFHPDDPEWTLADPRLLIDTDLILLTKGGAIEVDNGVLLQSSTKGDNRIQEQQAAMAIRQMGRLFPLDLPDAHLNTIGLEGIVPALLHIVDSARKEGTVYSSIVSLRPYTNSRQGKKKEDGYTGHPDHVIGAEAVEALFGLRPQFTELDQAVMPPEQWLLWPLTWRLGNQTIEVPKPDIRDCFSVNISPDARARQISAIREHRSQWGGSNGGQRQIARLEGIPPVDYYNIYTRP